MASTTGETGFRLPIWIDWVLLALLAGYTIAGMGLAPFHGDEAMQIYAANDYFTAIYRDSTALTTEPPYRVDSDAHLRILNGSINRYGIGLALDLAFAEWWRIPLPPPPGWQWALSYDDNAAQGYLPNSSTLWIARIPSSTLHVMSILMMFVFSRAVGGRGLAYTATLVYALHPVLLLNGRRALQESAMILFGLLSLWCATHLTSARSSEKPRQAHRMSGFSARALVLWGLLALACGLTLGSKHSGIVFVAGAAAWVLVGGFVHQQSQTAVSPDKSSGRRLNFLRLSAALLLSLAMALALFIACSPALWNDPLARLSDLVSVRGELLASQVAAAGAAESLSGRFSALFVQPFMTPLQIYEAPTFIGSAVDSQAAAYRASGLAGVGTDNLLGFLLTVCAVLGIATLVVPRLRRIAPDHAAGLLVTLLVIVISLLANPLPWQRYFMPLTLLFCLYAALGLQTLMRTLQRFAPQSKA